MSSTGINSLSHCGAQTTSSHTPSSADDNRLGESIAHEVENGVYEIKRSQSAAGYPIQGDHLELDHS